MADVKKAAIDRDAIEAKPLSSLSAADFLSALTAAGTIGIHAIRFWPEKKKYELYLEPENLGGATLGGLIERVREKKKVELEKDLRPEVPKLVGAEHEWLDPRDLVTNPAIREVIQQEVAREVARQLKR